MSERELAVLCWQRAPDWFLGRAAFGGASWHARSSAAGVATAVRQGVERGEEQGSPIRVDAVRTLEVEVTVQVVDRTGPVRRTVGDPLRFPVDVVLGRVAEDTEVAEIIGFDQVFWVERSRDVPALVRHFVAEAVAGMGPEALARRRLIGRPTVSTSRVKERDVEVRPRRPERVLEVADKVTGRSEGLPGPWERTREIGAVHAALEAGRSVLVVGERGTGRSSVIEEAVCKPSLRGRIWRTHPRRMIAGARWLGEWQQQCDVLIAQIDELDAALWIEDLPSLATTGGNGAEDSLGAWIAPAVRDGRLPIVGELTPGELDALRVRLPQLVNAATVVELGPLGADALTAIQRRLGAWLADQRGIAVDERAGRLALRLLDRFQRTEQHPGKLVSLLLACVTEARRRGASAVDEAMVVDVLTRRSGLSPVLVDDRVPLRRDEVVTWLEGRIRGQPDAVHVVADVLATVKAALNDPARPLATLLFAGPTGVGKTATAQALAEWAFGTGLAEPPLVRIDMSELQHPAQIGRLIGDVEPGELVRRVRERAFSVVLLDEVEKAHPAFFDTLLGMLDEGRLTDSFGRTTDFRGCVIIMTTNLGVRRGSSLGFGGAVGGVDLGAIRSFFRPEMLNRVDRVVAFRPLGVDSVREIAARELESIGRRPGFAARRLRLLFGTGVIDRVVQAGFDPLLGARPLQRAVEQLVVAELARHVLEHPPADGAELLVEEVDGQIVVAG